MLFDSSVLDVCLVDGDDLCTLSTYQHFGGTQAFTFCTEGGHSVFLRNANMYLQVHTALLPNIDVLSVVRTLDLK
jgi:hypothetical protein